MTAPDLLARLRADGYRVALREDGAGLRIEPRPNETVLVALRQHGKAVADELRTEAEVESLLAGLVADRIELERAGALPAPLLPAAELRELVEGRRRTLGLDVAADLVRRLYAAAVAGNVEALANIEGGR